MKSSKLEIPGRLAKSIFQKDSPDKWLGDVISVKPKGQMTQTHPIYELSPFKKFSN